MASPLPPVVAAVEEVQAAGVETVLAALKGLESAELFKVMKQLVVEAEKRSKAAAVPRRAAATKKAGSMPKGVVPPQLRKPRAWVDFTLKHALEHGWEAFTVYQSKKDKVTGEKVEEEIEMPASELLSGVHVYKGSVDEKHPAGKQLIHKDAMSLSKQRWAPKEKTGTHHALYQEFEGTYVDDSSSTSSSSDSDSEKKVIVRKTVAEKTAEAEAKKAEKEAAKEAAKAAKEQEKEAKKAEKEAEKAAKLAEKEAEKQAKAATKKATVPVKAVTPVAAKMAAAAPVAAPVAAAKPVATKPAAAKKAAESWSCPADGMVHPWSYKGKQYLRNSDNEVWLKGADGGCGEWQGMFKPAEDRIDDSVAEPVFDDDE
jgi:hypothetical protein